MRHIEFVKPDNEWTSLGGDEEEAKPSPRLKSSGYTDIRYVFSQEKEEEFGTIVTRCYAVRRPDCYWAVICSEEEFPAPVIRQLTPFAFTDIKVLYQGSTLVVVDQFGKKGVFDCAREAYVIPCEYEDISDLGGACIVKKAGFVGRLNHSGGWLEHLHR